MVKYLLSRNFKRVLIVRILLSALLDFVYVLEDFWS